MTEDLVAQGFEIVTDENGQELVKLMFMDENNETSGYALVSVDDANKIMSGEATLQNAIDEDGKQVLTLVAVEQNQEVLESATSGQPQTDALPTVQPSQNELSQTDQPSTTDLPASTEETMATESAALSAIDAVDDDAEGNAITDDETTEQYTINEQTAILNGQTIQMVTLLDTNGNVLDQKHGQVGEQVVIELHGQAFAYEMRGPTETGEPITSHLVVSASDADETCQTETEVNADGVSQGQWNADNQKIVQENGNTEVPAGQQFTLTEAVTIVDGKALQTVILEDDKGNVIDQKQGRTGEHTIIQLNGNSLDYVFLGPSDTGEPITTVLVVTGDGDGQGSDDETLVSESEAGLTAANWAPAGLPLDLYASLRHKAENIANERLHSRPELSHPNARPEPYHRKLGPYASYQEMVELVKNYKVGESQGETLERYDTLRNYAKIFFRTAGPQARQLTIFETVVNEVASQLCRFKPGLLFHKRELFHLAKEVAEMCRVEIEAAQTHIASGIMNTGSGLQHHQQQQQSQSILSQSGQQPQESAAVSGQVASSQLALLESRGLTAIQPTSVAQGSVLSAVVASGQQLTQSGVMLTFGKDQTTDQAAAMTIVGQTTSSTGLSIRGKQPIGNSALQHYLPNMPMMKRELIYKLSPSEEEALRLAAINAIADLSSIEIKQKSDCTNIERACWEQAVDLASRTDNLSGLASVDNGNSGNVVARANLLVNDATRVDSVREAAAIYGRLVTGGGGSTGSMQQQIINPFMPTRPPSLPALTPYEVACNEAAAYLASGQPAFLTRRRELVELSRKVVRNSGFQFTHTPSLDRNCSGPGGYRFYCSDQVMELDLSAAEHILRDPMERSDLDEQLHSASPKSDSTESDCPSLNMSCEEHNNIIDEIAIYSATGTDTMKKVRILNLSDCSFTGLIPLHLNLCVNLVELNLSNNCLHAIPRCLHLPKLRRLNIRGNPMLVRFCHLDGPPLVEQFPRLVSLDLDPELRELLKPQSLAYLCPHLTSINCEDFSAEVSEETIKAAQSAKQELAALVHSKWEDDLVGFYKKSVPFRDVIRVVETLVLHAVNQSVAVDEPFSHCKAVLARRIAEEFLAPKVVDEDEDDDGAGEPPASLHRSTTDDGELVLETNGGASVPVITVTNATTGDRETEVTSVPANNASSGVPEMADFGDPKEPCTKVDSSEPLTKNEVGAVENTNEIATTNGKVEVKKEGEVREVLAAKRAAEQAEREALAAAHNMALLPDEPLDKLSNVIGMALQHGKTVVYSVIRTAARQPNGELIPVGSSAGLANGGSFGSGFDGKSGRVVLEDQGDQSDAENSSLITQARKNTGRTSSVGMRRPGLLSGRASGAQKRRVGTAADGSISRRPVFNEDEDENEEESHYAIGRSRVYEDVDADLDDETYDMDDEGNLLGTDGPVKHHSAWEPGKRGRPPLAQSQKKALAEAEEQETVAILQKVKIPPPHAPPPATLRMSTRDSNRMKRFSAYGAIDTAAALAGHQKALITAAFAMEDEETEENISKADKDDDAEEVKHHMRKIQQEAVAAASAVTKELSKIAAAADVANDDSTTNLDQSQTITVEEDTVHVEDGEGELLAIVPSPSDVKKRKSTTSQPTTSTIKVRKVVQSSVLDSDDLDPISSSLDDETTVKQLIALSIEQECQVTVPSLQQMGEIVDFDPLHFIRCHARDNDPLDCSTKVWRCAFEPNPLDQSGGTTTVVATCGGECVCLIDCRTGKVMKRFKHIGEEFYTVAWTTVEMATGHRTNLLAAAGKLREIRLLHPEQLVCYAEMRGHKEEIACMLFHPKKPTILFSGDSKAFILVWDIGVPSAPEYRTKHHLLMRLICPRSNLNPVLNLVFMPNYDTLLAGCEDGVFAWTIQDFKKDKANEERLPTMELKIPTRREPCFDGLARVSENLVAAKCVEEGEIYIFDFSQLLLRKKRNTTSKKTVPVEILGQLRWQTTEEIYINVTARPGLGAVVCGDNEGTIWLYDLQANIRNQKDSKKFKMKPVKILEWPECSVGGNREDDAQLKDSITSGFKNPVVNTTDISSDGQFLVAVTDNNLVCIWNFSG